MKQYYVVYDIRYTNGWHRYDERDCNIAHYDSETVTKKMLEYIVNEIRERTKEFIPGAENITVTIVNIIPLDEDKEDE